MYNRLKKLTVYELNIHAKAINDYETIVELCKLGADDYDRILHA